jgi:hypothetical protein
MNAKKSITVLLLLFVVAAMGTIVIKGVAQERQTDSTKKKETGDQTQPDKTTPVQTPKDAYTIPKPNSNCDVVYYFMTTQRCPSCMKIEAYTKEAVQLHFADALKKGKIVWSMINIDQTENNHFIEDYQLFTKSVVLVKIRDGKQVEWENLDRVWELLNDKTGFQEYVTDEVKKFVGKSS